MDELGRQPGESSSHWLARVEALTTEGWSEGQQRTWDIVLDTIRLLVQSEEVLRDTKALLAHGRESRK